MVQWRSGRRSGNVQDRRGMGGKVVGGGIGTLVLVLAVALLGGDPSALLDVLGGDGGSANASGPPPAGDEEAAFVSTILASTEDVWTVVFAENDARYREPTLVLFSDRVQSACGVAGAVVGPFYCPPDETVYLDLSFFDALAQMGGPGDFATAYVVGHEVGHHVQNLLGTADRVRSAQQGLDEVSANQLSVRLELQADCYAGVWANRADQRNAGIQLDPGDVEEGLAAAAAIGDDRLQRRAGRDVVQESFTHGSSEQRQRWLLRGLQTGSAGSCDTFQG